MTPPVTPPLKRILFVDDDRAFLDSVTELLQASHPGACQLLTAGSSAQALSLLRAMSVDLLVLDAQMPVVNGLQFLRLLERKYPSLRKVMLTAFASEELRRESLENGAELFLEKPTRPDGYETLFATLLELASIEDATPPAEPAPTPTKTAGTPPLPMASRPAVQEPETSIQEVVICSGLGQVLHEWQCRNLEARVRLLEKGAQALARLLESPAGSLDHWEISANGERLVLQLRPDRRVLVRSNHPPTSSRP